MKLKLLSIFALSGLLQAETMQFTEYVQVSSSTAQYQTTSQNIPYQDCRDEQVSVGNSRNNNIAGSVLGGAIGGVIGHQIGAGKGNDIATVAGSILGTIVGGNTIGNRAYAPQRVETKRNCTTRYRQSRAQRTLAGYENVAYYKGKRITKFSNQRLNTIPVTVTIDY